MSLSTTKGRPDLLLRADSYLFLVQVRQSSSASSVLMAVNQLRRYSSEIRSQTARSTINVPLLVVPYMGQAGRRICDEEGISWLDLSDNADIRAPRLRVFMTGHKNKFQKRGRKATPFAPKASRLARQLLLSPQRKYTQNELVELTGMGQGFVSRTLRTLEQENFVTRTGRTFQATNPVHLLDSWQEAYDFTKHRILKGHIATRSSEELAFSLSHAIQSMGLSCAATGLAGAWLLTRFAPFRLVTLYLKDEPSLETLAEQGFRQVEKGANVWLVIPNDEGVFFGTKVLNGIPCAHPLQVYLDLKSHPERSKEAAEHLREQCLAEIIHAPE